MASLRRPCEMRTLVFSWRETLMLKIENWKSKSIRKNLNPCTSKKRRQNEEMWYLRKPKEEMVKNKAVTLMRETSEASLPEICQCWLDCWVLQSQIEMALKDRREKKFPQCTTIKWDISFPPFSGIERQDLNEFQFWIIGYIEVWLDSSWVEKARMEALGETHGIPSAIAFYFLLKMICRVDLKTSGQHIWKVLFVCLWCAFNPRVRFGLLVHSGDSGKLVLVRQDLEVSFGEGVLEEAGCFGTKNFPPSEMQTKWSRDFLNF